MHHINNIKQNNITSVTTIKTMNKQPYMRHRNNNNNNNKQSFKFTSSAKTLPRQHKKQQFEYIIATKKIYHSMIRDQLNKLVGLEEIQNQEVQIQQFTSFQHNNNDNDNNNQQVKGAYKYVGTDEIKIKTKKQQKQQKQNRKDHQTDHNQNIITPYNNNPKSNTQQQQQTLKNWNWQQNQSLNTSRTNQCIYLLDQIIIKTVYNKLRQIVATRKKKQAAKYHYTTTFLNKIFQSWHKITKLQQTQKQQQQQQLQVKQKTKKLHKYLKTIYFSQLLCSVKSNKLSKRIKIMKKIRSYKQTKNTLNLMLSKFNTKKQLQQKQQYIKKQLNINLFTHVFRTYKQNKNIVQKYRLLVMLRTHRNLLEFKQSKQKIVLFHKIKQQYKDQQNGKNIDSDRLLFEDENAIKIRQLLDNRNKTMLFVRENMFRQFYKLLKYQSNQLKKLKNYTISSQFSASMLSRSKLVFKRLQQINKTEKSQKQIKYKIFITPYFKIMFNNMQSDRKVSQSIRRCIDTNAQTNKILFSNANIHNDNNNNDNSQQYLSRFKNVINKHHLRYFLTNLRTKLITSKKLKLTQQVIRIMHSKNIMRIVFIALQTHLQYDEIDEIDDIGGNGDNIQQQKQINKSITINDIKSNELKIIQNIDYLDDQQQEEQNNICKQTIIIKRMNNFFQLFKNNITDQINNKQCYQIFNKFSDKLKNMKIKNSLKQLKYNLQTERSYKNKVNVLNKLLRSIHYQSLSNKLKRNCQVCRKYTNINNQQNYELLPYQMPTNKIIQQLRINSLHIVYENIKRNKQMAVKQIAVTQMYVRGIFAILRKNTSSSRQSRQTLILKKQQLISQLYHNKIKRFLTITTFEKPIHNYGLRSIAILKDKQNRNNIDTVMALRVKLMGQHIIRKLKQNTMRSIKKRDKIIMAEYIDIFVHQTMKIINIIKMRQSFKSIHNFSQKCKNNQQQQQKIIVSQQINKKLEQQNIQISPISNQRDKQEIQEYGDFNQLKQFTELEERKIDVTQQKKNYQIDNSYSYYSQQIEQNKEYQITNKKLNQNSNYSNNSNNNNNIQLSQNQQSQQPEDSNQHNQSQQNNSLHYISNSRHSDIQLPQQYLIGRYHNILMKKSFQLLKQNRLNSIQSKQNNKQKENDNNNSNNNDNGQQKYNLLKKCWQGLRMFSKQKIVMKKYLREFDDISKYSYYPKNKEELRSFQRIVAASQ